MRRVSWPGRMQRLQKRVRRLGPPVPGAMRLEVEEYVDSKLANFEVVLQKTLAAVELDESTLDAVDDLVRRRGGDQPGVGQGGDRLEKGSVAVVVPAVEPEGSFLENVFGELDETAAEAAEEATPEKSDDSDEGDGGFGLLRRRGLGAAFRELADS